MPNSSGSVDANKAAQDILPGSLKREFPAQFLGNTLNEIKEMLKIASGARKRDLQKAKKLLEQIPRLMGD
jgi:hypothetical protein